MTNFVLWPHVLGGTVALAVLVVPLVTRKGGSLHRRAGWVFVLAMALAAASGIVLGGLRALTARGPGDLWAGAHFMLIGLLTGAGVVKGVRVLKWKARTGPVGSWFDRALAALVLLVGVGAVVAGIAGRRPLLVAFGLLAARGGWSGVGHWRSTARAPRFWWLHHMSDMTGAGIAALTAFLVLNASRMGFGPFSIALWILPTALGIPAVIWWQRRLGLRSPRQEHLVEGAIADRPFDELGTKAHHGEQVEPCRA